VSGRGGICGAIALGLVLAAIAQFIALAIAGAGHGWITPFWFSPALFVLNPIAFARAARRGKAEAVDIVLIALAGALDVALFAMTLQEGTQYFSRVSPFNWIWLGLWLLWQIAGPVNLALIELRGRPDADDQG